MLAASADPIGDWLWVIGYPGTAARPGTSSGTGSNI